MKFTGLVALAGAAAAVTNSTQPQVVTTVVTAYTTYCPSRHAHATALTLSDLSLAQGPTVIRVNANKTITVTAATTLTITGMSL
ncbi:hypothetical protein NLG97_g10060 [Lecanicillium saksenae]|uniref:Uncharacterized protein n=1 Tax=Lecanicillium saksenae TaxID=468837 RepID=A0ACC1QI75_9HYPO|nr:hypothetical protein NLG97_g10060 [Lecanicillium saksenae]